MSTVFVPARRALELARRSLRPATVSSPGPGVVSLIAGDPDFPTPDPIRAALAEAMASGFTRYAHSQGDPELREVLASLLSRRSRHVYTPEQVLVTHGASAALAAVMLAVLDPGQRVIIPEPTYSLYADLAALAGAEIAFVRHRPDLHLDLDGIAAAAPGARMVVVCNPCNPTGAVYSRAELEALAVIAREHGLLVLCDEAYDHVVYEGVDFTSALEIEGLAEQLVYVQSFSKTYAMTGWRVGYLAAPPDLVVVAASLHRTFNGPVNSAVQRAALAAATLSEEWSEGMRREYQARRDLVVRMVQGVPGVRLQPPQGTFYALLGYRLPLPSTEVARLALERGVAVRAGAEYGPGGEGFVRIAFSADRTLLVEGLERLLPLLAGEPRT
ncbi:MAG TPA: aminotransferase class I/II-fold pyridoxal phosphate-dependent enzyme [Candidatus Dormibacteraeota bacterium]|nr:aminotransferase class I/II-fold pyridoxal phosphate-dependent enzyme [Candidatus Dormibacteraeota bacterium]